MLAVNSGTSGATPVFADLDPETGNLDPASVEAKITAATQAVIPVHWTGYPCDLDAIHAVARRHRLAVIEDAAHALGATYKGRPIGSLSRFTCFSFFRIFGGVREELAGQAEFDRSQVSLPAHAGLSADEVDQVIAAVRGGWCILALCPSPTTGATMDPKLDEKIRAYWEDPDTRSLIDRNLRRLEEGVVGKYLEPGFELLDVGCGDGASTLTYARQVKRCVGLERSDHLREKAAAAVAEARLQNVEILAGDVLELAGFRHQFDVVLSQRVLINLTSWDDQREAIRQLRSTLRPGGLCILIENTFEGHDAMNAWRERMGLGKISRHWHNLYFRHEALVEYLEDQFELVAFHRFELYYLLTRIYANLVARFEGFGKAAEKDPIFDQLDEAARRLQEELGDDVSVGQMPAFGPVQGFVARKMDDE